MFNGVKYLSVTICRIAPNNSTHMANTIYQYNCASVCACVIHITAFVQCFVEYIISLKAVIP